MDINEVDDIITELENLAGPPAKPLAEMSFEERWNYELDVKGWVALNFTGWVRDTVILAADENVKTPAGYAVYTLKEFEMIVRSGAMKSDMHLVHYAKKHYGAVITQITEKRMRVQPRAAVIKGVENVSHRLCRNHPALPGWGEDSRYRQIFLLFPRRQLVMC